MKSLMLVMVVYAFLVSESPAVHTVIYYCKTHDPAHSGYDKEALARDYGCKPPFRAKAMPGIGESGKVLLLKSEEMTTATMNLSDLQDPRLNLEVWVGESGFYYAISPGDSVSEEAFDKIKKALGSQGGQSQPRRTLPSAEVRNQFINEFLSKSETGAPPPVLEYRGDSGIVTKPSEQDLDWLVESGNLKKHLKTDAP